MVHLVRRTALAEGIAALGGNPLPHGDNCSTLKATTVLAMLNWLGVKPSYSRPRFLSIGSQFTLRASSPRSVTLTQLGFASFAVID